MSIEDLLRELLTVQQRQCSEFDLMLQAIRLLIQNQEWPNRAQKDAERIADAIETLLLERAEERSERVSHGSERRTTPPPELK
jgi:hypothetical protein